MKIEDIAKEINECWEMEVNKNDTTTELAKKLTDLKYKIVKNCSIPVVSSRFDDIYTHPFRVGRKQGKAVLDAKGLQVVFMATEKQAQMYCTYLNGY